MQTINNKKIFIIDYGINNILSIQRVFGYFSNNVRVIRNGSNIKQSEIDYLVLPGTGSFIYGYKNLKNKKFINLIKNHHIKQKPLIGICLGMQLFLTESYEFKKTKGLNFVDGKVLKLSSNKTHKIPNVGFKKVDFVKEKKSDYLFFLHSYYCEVNNKDYVHTKSKFYDFEFVSSFKKDNLLGCQYHPEKSGVAGLKIVKEFLGL